VHGARLVEQRHGDARDLLCVLRPVVAPLCQFYHAPPTYVRVAARLQDFLAVPSDVVEDKTLPEREVAQGYGRRTEPADDRIEEHRAGDREVGAPRLEARHAKTFFEVEIRE